MKEIDDITFLSQCLELGLIEPDQITSWADSQIATTEQPPYWMIELSSDSISDLLTIRKLFYEGGAATQVDDDTFLSLVAGFYSVRNDANKTMALLYERFCVDWKEMTDFRKELFTIDDELGWNESKGISRLKILLEKHLPAFIEHAGRIGLKHNKKIQSIFA